MSCLWTAHTRQTSIDSPYFTLLVWQTSIANFRLAYAFFKEEKQNDYMWALSKLAAILTPETRPAVIVTDRELSLMASFDKCFYLHHACCAHGTSTKTSCPNANENLRRASNGTCFFSSGLFWWLLTRKWNLKNSGKSNQTLLTASLKSSRIPL